MTAFEGGFESSHKKRFSFFEFRRTGFFTSMDTDETNEHELTYISDDEPQGLEHQEYVQTSFGIFDPESEEGKLALQLIEEGIIEGKRKRKKSP